MKNMAVVLVDMQDFFLKNFSVEVRKRLIAEQSKILNVCIKKNIPIIVLEYKAGGKDRGNTTPKLHKIIRTAAEEVIIKENNSGFTKTRLGEILEGLKTKRLMIMGINANGCVQDTTIGALKRGYEVITAEDLIASASNKDGRLSRKNKVWFESRTTFYKKAQDLSGKI